MDGALEYDDFFDDPPASGSGNQPSNGASNVFPSPVKSTKKISSRRFSSSSSDSESISTHPSDLHGTHDTLSESEHKSDKFSSSVSGQYSRTATSSSISDTDSELTDNGTSEDELFSSSKRLKVEDSNSSSSDTMTSSESNATSKHSESRQNHEISQKKEILKPKESSDSMTDVSPLTSPDKSPDMVQQRKPKLRDYADDLPDVPVRHITKLNVVFKNDPVKPNEVKQTKSRQKSNHGQFDYQSVQWSSSESDEELNDYNRNCNSSHGAHKKRQSRKTRQDNAAFNHRQRLLDSAARGSMDVSSLLETVLEFEKSNYERKKNRVMETPINYHLGEKLLQDHDRRHRKNMSFSNDKVREIDQENRRLLNKIRNQSRPSSASSVRSNRSTRSTASTCSRQSSASSRSGSRRRDADKPLKLYHSAVNRLQFQRRIERENMQLLKRLQSAKPTPGLQRQRQLTQYKQQSDYMGTTINRNGMSIQRANELTRNAEVVQKAMGLSKSKPVRPAWEDKW